MKAVRCPVSLAIEKLAGKITKKINMPITYTNSYVDVANKLEGTK